MSKENSKAIIIVSKEINASFLDYYNTHKKSEFDLIFVTPKIGKDLIKKYHHIKFIKDNYFLSKSDFKKYKLKKTNWYYQQFLKYSIVLKLNYVKVHIIDGDSYLSPKIFFTKSFMYTNIKINSSYQKFTDVFTNNLKSTRNFIVNHMVFEKKYLKEMLLFMGTCENSFIDDFSKVLNSNKILFSEYQNYGMYMITVYEAKIESTKVFRRLDLITNFNIDDALKYYSLVSIEKHHSGGIFRRIRAILKFCFKQNLG